MSIEYHVTVPVSISLANDRRMSKMSIYLARLHKSVQAIQKAIFILSICENDSQKKIHFVYVRK